VARAIRTCPSYYLNQLVRDHFFGALTLKYEAGRLIHIRKEENLKPSELLSGTPEKHVTERNPERLRGAVEYLPPLASSVSDGPN